MEFTNLKDIRQGLKNINANFIVLEVSQAIVTKEKREIRTFKVADPTACMNLSVWDEPGQFLMPGDIVRLTKGYASLWQQCLTLYVSKLGEIHKVGEFCMVINEQLNMSEPTPPPPESGGYSSITNNGTTNAVSGPPNRNQMPSQSSNATSALSSASSSMATKSGNGGGGSSSSARFGGESSTKNPVGTKTNARGRGFRNGGRSDRR